MANFRKKPIEEKRDFPFLTRWTRAEWAKVKTSAAVRDLDVTEFIRRAALGRKADVHIETQVILALSDVTRAARQLHAAYVEHGAPPPIDELRQLILDARQAMLQISK